MKGLKKKGNKNMKEVSIRFLTEADEEEVNRVEQNSMYKISETLDSEEYALGIFLKDRLIGYCTQGSADAIGEDYDDILLSDVFVDEEYRRKGYGTQLVKCAIKLAIEKNCTMFAQVLDGELDSFYKRLGFFIEGDIYQRCCPYFE